MANISKFINMSIDNVEKIMGVDKDNLSKFMGVSLSTPHPNEVLYLNFEDASTIIDKSVGGNNSWSVIPSGSFGDVISTSNPKYGTRCLSGINNKAVKHELTAALSLGTSDFTIQLWFYPLSSQPAMANGYVPIFGGEIYSRGVMFYRPSGVAPANALHWYEPGGGYITSTALNINTWNHIRLVRASGKYYIFQDGVLESPGAGFNSMLNLTSTWSPGFFLLREPPSRRCTGSIDAFQIIKTSLGTSNFTPPERTSG